MSTVNEQLRDWLLAHSAERHLADVRMGIGYTAVLLDDQSLGVAYTVYSPAAAERLLLVGKGPLVGRSTSEVLTYLVSSDPRKVGLALAVANALVNRPSASYNDGDVLALLSLRADDRLAMVGFFAPLLAPLEKTVREVVIFERDASRSKRALPAEQALTELPSCDVAVITSSTLINGTLDRVLAAAANCREVALVGPSTPLVGEVFAALGVTLLSGTIATEPLSILQAVSEGGGTRSFMRYSHKVNLRLTATDH
ncbi:MAG: Rossmann-like domain-containing protein [Thermoleophilia bacterium]